MRKELEQEMLEFESEISKYAKESVRKLDESIMTKLKKIEHNYVGWRFNSPEPFIIKTDMYSSETPIKCDMTVQFIGFDDEKDFINYLNEGFYVFDKKYLHHVNYFKTDNILSFNEFSDEDIRSIEKSNVLYFGEDKKSKEEFIGSLEVEDYLNAYINDSDNGLQEKIIMSNFLNDYMDKDLYVVEFFRDKGFYIRVENEDDEIISDELFLGVEVTKEESKNIDKNIEHYELLINTDMTINKFVDNILNDEEISAEDKIFMIRDFIKYLNKGLYRQDAEDMFGNMCQLIMDQNTHEIIDKINY